MQSRRSDSEMRRGKNLNGTVLDNQINHPFTNFSTQIQNLYLRNFGVKRRAGLKGRGARGNFYCRAPMMYFMTSYFVKITLLLIRNVLVCFYRYSRMY